MAGDEPAHVALARELGFELEICELAASHGAIARANGVGAELGLSIAVEDGDAAERLMAKVQARLVARGYRAFWSERLRANGSRESNEVVILRTDDPYAIVRFRGSNGSECWVSAEDIVDRLKAWEGICSFDVIGGGGSWVAVQFGSLPEKICAFAEEVYLFCPGSVEEGVALARAGDDPETFAAARRLCPTVSARVGQELKGEIAEMFCGDIPEALRARYASEAEMGVRWLAQELRRTKYLFLWWD